ncbi:MAG: hypothetical protein BroJett011_17760 [Chloroflexota bacterium]|nr:MAG: hypothetical protein BroJett011_17760 [Chloroflexota bacterium]
MDPLEHNDTNSPAESTPTTPSYRSLEQGEVVDFFSEARPAHLDRLMSDLATLGNFLHYQSQAQRGGLEALADSLRLLQLIEEERLVYGRGIIEIDGLHYRFQAKYGRAPLVDPVGVIRAAQTPNWVTTEGSVKLTDKGVRILGDLFRIVQDWFAFHTRDFVQQNLYLAQREMEKIAAYDDLGFKTDALSRSIFFLRENIADFQKKRHDYILRGTAPERLQALRARYEQLISDIDLRLKAGQLHAEVHRRAIDVRMTAFGVVFEALKDLFAVAAQQTRAAASILSDAAFYDYLVTHLEGDALVAASRATGDVWLPLQLPVAPGQPFARGAVAEVLGDLFVALEPGEMPGEEVEGEEPLEFFISLDKGILNQLPALAAVPLPERLSTVLQTWDDNYERLCGLMAIGHQEQVGVMNFQPEGCLYEDERIIIYEDGTLERLKEVKDERESPL